MDSAADVVWRLVPLHTPRAIKICSKCNERKRFISSDRFRINAQQQNVDVWLIYKCEKCETTWNNRILRRVSPLSIEPDLYQRFLHNDLKTAWDLAFDVNLLKRNGVDLDTALDYVIEGDNPDWQSGVGEVRIVVRSEYAWRWRVDTLLAKRLPLSRRKIDKLFEEGGIVIAPQLKDVRGYLRDAALIVIQLPLLQACT